MFDSLSEDAMTDREKSLREISRMAVMKTCCGCLTTKSGSMAILLLYTIAYLALIIWSGVKLGDDEFQTWTNDQFKDDNDCKTGDHKDAWWCDALVDVKGSIIAVLVVYIIIGLIFLVSSILAIFGTSKGNHWFMLPWIILKGIFLTLLGLLMTTFVILLCVYMPEGDDSSGIIATGVIFAAKMAFLFYLWLCVVSHFQILREVSKLGLDKLEHVQPFNNEEDSIYDTEDYNPDAKSLHHVEDIEDEPPQSSSAIVPPAECDAQEHAWYKDEAQ